MAICWFCHWGWPKPIADIFDRAEQELGSDYCLVSGPSHIVWEDENFEDDHIDYCLGLVDERRDSLLLDGWTEQELEIVKMSLRELKGVPAHLRTEPEGYEDDDEHPEKYPPPEGLEMVKR